MLVIHNTAEQDAAIIMVIARLLPATISKPPATTITIIGQIGGYGMLSVQESSCSWSLLAQL